MKKKWFILALFPIVLVSCGDVITTTNIQSSSSLSSSGSSNENQRFGLEGNQDEDKAEKKDSSELKELLTSASTITKYSYETTVSIVEQPSHFIDYFSPTAFYEDNDDSSLSFGYGQENGTNNVFKYYLSEDKNTVYPSIYEYIDTLSGDLSILTDLYGSFSLASISLLTDTLDTFSASYVKGNQYVLTDDETASIFQYMTTFGSSISSYMTAVYITIIDLDSVQFKVTVECGSYGNIESIFTPLEESITDIVEEQISNSTLSGVSAYSDVSSFLNKAANNNYVIEGIRVKGVNSDTLPTYRIHLTQSYFYLEYLSYDASGNEIASSYSNWGYAFVKKGQTITIKEKDDDGNDVESTIGPLNYDSCFGFTKGEDGFYFDFFKGPVESDSQKYLEVESLPETGDSQYLYIVPNQTTGEKEVYEWIEIDGSTGEMGFSRYSSWYDNVGDFAINDASATFYLTGTSGITDLGDHFFEKNLEASDSYYSSSSDILSMIANGLFGWGFQSTTTWISYVQNSFLKVYKDSNNEVNKADLGLGVKASIDGGDFSIQNIYYTYDFSRSGSVSEVEDFFLQKGVILA